jgi:hypothetical protein
MEEIRNIAINFLKGFVEIENEETKVELLGVAYKPSDILAEIENNTVVGNEFLADIIRMAIGILLKCNQNSNKL